MRILIHGINYSPELTGIGKYTGEMVSWLAGQGHEVRVVTAPPYYPEWKVGTGYASGKYRREKIEQVTVWRCPLWIPKKISGKNRLIHLASFAVSSLPLIFYQMLWRPDSVIVIEPPFFCAPQALFLARLVGANAWLHVQDFEVDAAFDLGLLSSMKLRNFALSIERWIMKRFDRVSSISDNMVQKLYTKGITPERTQLFLNWVDTDSIYPLPDYSPMRTALGFSENVTIALYSGNMGEKQGLEILIEAARLLRQQDHIHFVICGEGASKQRLMAFANGLANITFLPLQPLERLNDLLNMADIHLLPQKADIADLVMPSKLTGMLASGRPVVATAQEGTQVARVVDGCGKIVPPGEAQAFADAIVELAASPEEQRRLGTNARNYAVTHWSKEAVLKGFEGSLIQLYQGKRK